MSGIIRVVASLTLFAAADIIEISEMMMITHNNMLMADEGWFTLQLVLDLLIIAILICLFRHLMQKMTEPEVHEESTAVRMTAVVKEEPAVPSEAPETNDTTERS